jgi:hypothetical protein
VIALNDLASLTTRAEATYAIGVAMVNGSELLILDMLYEKLEVVQAIAKGICLFKNNQNLLEYLLEATERLMKIERINKQSKPLHEQVQILTRFIESNLEQILYDVSKHPSMNIYNKCSDIMQLIDDYN